MARKELDHSMCFSCQAGRYDLGPLIHRLHFALTATFDCKFHSCVGWLLRTGR